MKTVYVRRHAQKHPTGELTQQGKERATELSKKLPRYHRVISSPRLRTMETAVLLTGINPEMDSRASTPPLTPEQERLLHEAGIHHVHGIAGAIFDIPEHRASVLAKGNELAELVKELLMSLPEDGTALIVSHDGVMVAAEMVLRGEILDQAGKTFRPLEGFVIDEAGNITLLQS